jgi:hypothetical protein
MKFLTLWHLSFFVGSFIFEATADTLVLKVGIDDAIKQTAELGPFQ